ncbi:hypothetical protein F5X98DRAFT_380724 [Xylaria grammica]|nr:hypothetical protein F5X98DRAFT_380724 [Xylaria grammica]
MPSIRQWLDAALPNKPFIYPLNQAPAPDSDQLSISFAKSVEVQKWPDLAALPALTHLGADPDRPLTTSSGDPVSPPVVLDALRVLTAEASLENFLNLSLIYCINLALHSMYAPGAPLTIVPHIPFAQVTPSDNAALPSERCTPDYTVFRGDAKADPAILTRHRASLVVGNVTLRRQGAAAVPRDPVAHTTRLGRSALGQLLWHCVCRETRFGFSVSDAELVLVEFAVRHDG